MHSDTPEIDNKVCFESESGANYCWPKLAKEALKGRGQIDTGSSRVALKVSAFLDGGTKDTGHHWQLLHCISDHSGSYPITDSQDFF